MLWKKFRVQLRHAEEPRLTEHVSALNMLLRLTLLQRLARMLPRKPTFRSASIC